MPPEIIDLTNSPPSSPRILHFGGVSAERIQLERSPMSLSVSANPNLRHNNHQQTTMLQQAGHAFEPSNITTGFQPHMHGDHQDSVVLEPLPELKAYLFPNGTKFRGSWTPSEHELFLMGLIKYGKGRWTKIARRFLWNKTPQQVQSYAVSFFRRLPDSNLYAIRRRATTLTNSHANNLEKIRNKNLIMAASASSYPNAMVVNEAQQTLMLFPDQTPFSPHTEASTSNNTITHGFQIQASGASTSITADSANGEVDLELRLG